MQIVFRPRAVKDLKSISVQDRNALLEKLETYAETRQGDVKKTDRQPVFQASSRRLALHLRSD